MRDRKAKQLVLMNPLLGDASINIETKNSIITVTHGTDDDVLFKCKGYEGDWDRFWDFIYSLGGEYQQKQYLHFKE